MMQRLTELLLIKHGERSQVFYFLILFFFIGTGMAIGRGASETLFFKRYGIEYLPFHGRGWILAAPICIPNTVV